MLPLAGMTTIIHGQHQTMHGDPRSEPNESQRDEQIHNLEDMCRIFKSRCTGQKLTYLDVQHSQQFETTY